MCQTNPANIGTQKASHPTNSRLKPFSRLRGVKSNVTSYSSIYSSTYPSMLCQHCHQDAVWLPAPMSISLDTTPISVLQQNSLKPIRRHATKDLLLLNCNKPMLTVQSATYYAGYMRAAILAFKYKEDLSALPILVHAIRQLPRPKNHYKDNSVIIAAPTTNRRLVKRGFDPVTILSYYLSRHWGIPLWKGVSRVDNTVSQQGLNRQERRQNVSNAFQLTLRPPARRIIIFDDVVTTGATITELVASFETIAPPLQITAYTLAQVPR